MASEIPTVERSRDLRAERKAAADLASQGKCRELQEQVDILRLQQNQLVDGFRLALIVARGQIHRNGAVGDDQLNLETAEAVFQEVAG